MNGVERAATHEGERSDLHDPPIEQAFHTVVANHVVQGVVERTQIGIDLRHHVARQEAQAFACLDRRAGEDDALDLAGLQSPNRHRNGEPRLAGTRRTDAEGDHVVRDRLDVRLRPADFGRITRPLSARRMSWVKTDEGFSSARTMSIVRSSVRSSAR